jgi:hypothetical protein
MVEYRQTLLLHSAALVVRAFITVLRVVSRSSESWLK